MTSRYQAKADRVIINEMFQKSWQSEKISGYRGTTVFYFSQFSIPLLQLNLNEGGSDPKTDPASIYFCFDFEKVFLRI